MVQCFGLERVEGNKGERLGSVVREVSGFGEGNRKGGGGRWRVERGDCGGAWHGKDGSSARGKAVRNSGAMRGWPRRVGGGSGAAQSSGRHGSAPATAETERQAGGGRKRTGLRFPKIPGTQM